MQTPDQQQEAYDKLSELIADIQIAILTTLKDDGTLHSRPMATIQEEKFTGKLWFFTREHSAKVEEIQREQQVSLSYSRPDANSYVAISGTAQLVMKREKMEELWSPLYKAWFPEGLDDPELALLCITPQHLEYWDGPASKIVQVAGFIKALATGQSYSAGQHETLDF